MTNKPPEPQDERLAADEAFATTPPNLVSTPHRQHKPRQDGDPTPSLGAPK